MFNKVLGIAALIAVLFFSISPACMAKGPEINPKSKLENLTAAYSSEKNAQARYLLFAGQADKEGYAGVAVLFRAIARAEQVHYEHNAGEIKKLGGTAGATMETPVAKSTKENLERTLKEKTAKGAGKVDAAQAKLIKEALGNLEAWKAPKKDLSVCLVCGNIFKGIPPAICPICGAPKEKFALVK